MFVRNGLRKFGRGVERRRDGQFDAVDIRRERLQAADFLEDVRRDDFGGAVGVDGDVAVVVGGFAAIEKFFRVVAGFPVWAGGGVLLKPGRDGVERQVQEDDGPVGAHDLAVRRRDRESAFCGDNQSVFFGDGFEQFRLPLPEGGFAMGGEEFGDRAAEILFEQVVQIDGGTFEEIREGGGDGRLAGSHEACEEDIFHENANRMGEGSDLTGLGVCQDKNDGL